MFRRIGCVLGLAICLNILVELANDPQLRTECVPSGYGSPLDENQNAVTEAAVSVIAPCRASAMFLPDVNLTGFLTCPLLITSEPALLQLHLGEVTHQRWQHFGLAPVAPFDFSRSLPLQI